MEKFAKVDEPVILDKPSHHRELQSFHVPGDKVGYYKAYEGDKVVLVPKDNLEAMKELVNYKMRRRADSKFSHLSNQEEKKKEQERFQHKIEHLQHQIEEYETTVLEPLLEEYERSNAVDQAQWRFKKSEVAPLPSLKRSRGSIISLPLQDTSNEASLSDTISMSEPRQGSMPETKSIKFLISGHFRNNKKPIFIIRQYRGSSIIGRTKSDFHSSRNEKGVDISISGKFYTESVLEEENEELKNIKYKAHKKILIDDQSSVLEEGFIDTFSIMKFDVVVGGMFVKQPNTPYYTPLVSIAIKRVKHPHSREVGVGFASHEKKQTVMNFSMPAIENPFVHDLRRTQSDHKSGFTRKRTVATDDRKPQGFKSLLTRIDEGEEAFECPPHHKRRNSTSSKSSTSTRNSVKEKADKPRASSTLSKMFRVLPFNLIKRKESVAEEKGKKLLKTESTHITSLDPISPGGTNTEEMNLPSASQGEALQTTEHDNVVAPKPEVDQEENKSKLPKKPGFFKRIFNKLVSRR